MVAFWYSDARQLLLPHMLPGLPAEPAAPALLSPQVAFSRKEQLVILERCLQLLEEAVDDHVQLNSHVWNSVIYVAACTKQLQRAFQLLDQMQSAGVSTDEHTYGSLIEACVLAKEPELAQRLFNNAMREVGSAECCRGAAGVLQRFWCRRCCSTAVLQQMQAGARAHASSLLMPLGGVHTCCLPAHTSGVAAWPCCEAPCRL
jgi:pentatricopeptide repeat protein